MFVFKVVFRLSNKSTEKKPKHVITNVCDLFRVQCGPEKNVIICFMQGEDNLDRSYTHDLMVIVIINYSSI